MSARHVKVGMLSIEDMTGYNFIFSVTSGAALQPLWAMPIMGDIFRIC